MLKAIADRRAIRSFTEQPVEEEKLQEIFEAIRLSPSWMNQQCWKFIAVHDPETKRALARATAREEYLAELKSPAPVARPNSSPSPIESAPLVLVACAHPRESGDCREMDYYLVDMGIAVENLMLEAANQGLGSVCVALFRESTVKELLGIPENIRVVALVPVGYPAQPPRPQSRREVSDVVVPERWQ